MTTGVCRERYFVKIVNNLLQVAGLNARDVVVKLPSTDNIVQFLWEPGRGLVQPEKRFHRGGPVVTLSYSSRVLSLIVVATFGIRSYTGLNNGESEFTNR